MPRYFQFYSSKSGAFWVKYLGSVKSTIDSMLNIYIMKTTIPSIHNALQVKI